MITKDQFVQIKTLYESGKKATEISKLLNINYRQVQYRLYNLNNSNHNFSPKNCDFFEIIDTEEKAYWLGFIYADGCITGENNNAHRICIGLKKSDKDHLQKLANIFEINLKKNTQYTNQGFNGEYESIRFEICNKKIFKDLENCGIKQRKSYEETSDILNSISEYLIHHFIRGIFDGDGNVGYKINSKNNYCVFNISGSKDILEKIQKIIICKIRLNEIKIQQISDYCWKLQYGGRRSLKKFYEWLYKDATIWMERKRIIFEELIYPKYLDKESNFTGVTNQLENTKNPFRCRISIGGSQENIGSYPSELEAAYYHDLEQVRRRGEDAKQHMNFPSKYDTFIQWIQEGY